jgi:hypothetical protein
MKVRLLLLLVASCCTISGAEALVSPALRIQSRHSRAFAIRGGGSRETALAMVSVPGVLAPVGLVGAAWAATTSEGTHQTSAKCGSALLCFGATFLLRLESGRSAVHA